MVTVAVVEDHQVLVDALKLMMQMEPGFQFVGQASTLREGRALIRRNPPQVLLVDLGLPDGNGVDLIREVKTSCPDTQVVVLTSKTQRDVLIKAVDAGASGFMPKSCSLSELLNTIERAAEGEIVVPTSYLLGLMMSQTTSNRLKESEDQMWEELTTREKEILELLAKGESGNAIAEKLSIAPLTVRTHVRNMMSKLGVHSRLEAVSFGIRHGLVSPP